MTNKKIVHFVANAGLKDIVGKGLIYDDKIAIIELVKNSKDARATKTIIRFENEATIAENSSLIISDDGKGMTQEEIENKWLNIAYSEKKEEKDSGGKTNYAGNKGVGRFSCDRLGKTLILYTKSPEGDYLKLPIDWKLYENKKRNDEISSIPLECYTISKKDFLQEIGDDDFKFGTVLKIQGLRSEWNSKKLIKLISELEKFTPELDETFEVFLHSNTKYLDKDKKPKFGKIRNNILEKLAFKTTHIKSSIDNTGNSIFTSLYYQSEEIYTYEAVNPYTHLKNISVEVHFLDPLVKTYFHKNVGMNPNDYGSIFLFYNGFRISPYGNSKNDWLNLDQRKSQGTARNFGTREVFGRIDVVDEDNSFSVITSREGLAHNEAFFDLVAFDQDEKTLLRESGKEDYGFVTTIIRQLENFVVSGLEWNRLVDRLSPDDKKVVSNKDVLSSPHQYQLKEISPQLVKEACDKILKSNFEIKKFKINENKIRNISEIAEEKYQQFVKDFLIDTGSKVIQELSPAERTNLKKIVKVEQDKTRTAREERDYADKKRNEAEEAKKKAMIRAEIEISKNNFLETLSSPEKTLDALITHVVKQISGGVEGDIKLLLATYYKDKNKITKEELISALENIAMDMATIKESATMATKANFDLKVSSIKEDLFEFLGSYIREVASKEKKWGVKIHFNNQENLREIRSFRPAEICVLFVNILDNARKAGAKNLHVICSSNQISFSDDGQGFDFKKYTPEDFFCKGVSTTSDGSGLGLYHCQKIVDRLKGRISLENSEKKSGAIININFSS